LLAGAHLGGQRAVLAMQSSGVGNCINLLSLIQIAQFPFVALVSMRGDLASRMRGNTRWGKQPRRRYRQ
jgi:sulfopyruvate decarboxylase TPP-binding subunit